MQSSGHAAVESWEGERIYRILFDAPAPSVLLERFAGSAERLRALHREDVVRRHRQLLASRKDLEAIELAARWTGRLPLLTGELDLMLRLAETLPESGAQLVGQPKSWLLAVVGLTLATLRSAAKGVLGLALLLRVGRG